nr:hypothetical protein GCM10020185_52890 [Pseudomonas brassicacearum subsp. brassicacearum]
MTGADGMASPGHQFLAGAGFALDQQRCIQRRDPLGPGFEGADRRGFAQQRVETFGVIVMQGRQALADAVRLIQRQQRAGVGDGCGVQQQGLAVEGDFPQRQAKTVLQQGVQQGLVTEQLGHAFPSRFTTVQGNQRRIGQQHLAGTVQGQYRVGHGREQRIELQVPTLARQDVHHGDRLHAAHAEQRLAQLVEHLRAEGRGVDVDVGRHHLHRIQIEIAPTEQGQDFLGDADAVDKTDVDTHGAMDSGTRRAASMPWGGLMVKSWRRDKKYTDRSHSGGRR